MVHGLALGGPHLRALTGRVPQPPPAGGTARAKRPPRRFVASAWSAYPEEESDLIGVVHEALVGLGVTQVAGRPATVQLQESSDFELLHKFWSSHDRAVRASAVLDVVIE